MARFFKEKGWVQGIKAAVHRRGLDLARVSASVPLSPDRDDNVDIV